VSPGRNGSGPDRRIDLTLWGISDAELLGVIDDLGDENGWTHTIDVRLQLGEKIEETTTREKARSGVGPRLSWLLRYGWLEHPSTGDRSMWRLTAIGHALLDNPSLSKTVEAQLTKLNPAQRLRLTREIAEGGHESPAELRNALRRQWQRSLGR
jgi:hypothetical protein